MHRFRYLCSHCPHQMWFLCRLHQRCYRLRNFILFKGYHFYPQSRLQKWHSLSSMGLVHPKQVGCFCCSFDCGYCNLLLWKNVVETSAVFNWLDSYGCCCYVAILYDFLEGEYWIVGWMDCAWVLRHSWYLSGYSLCENGPFRCLCFGWLGWFLHCFTHL